MAASVNDVPSPAQQAEHNGMRRLPWEDALYTAVSGLEQQLADCHRERAETLAALTLERKRVGEARRRLENWKLRQAAWTTERTELLERLHGKGF
jgi:hypothetical protein